MRLKLLLGALCAAVSLSASAVIPASEQTVAVEFYHAVLDHYFISADSKEINDLDTGVHKGWTRTGYRFSVIKGGSSYAGTSPVCRFYSPTLDTHFYSAKKSECDEVKDKFGKIGVRPGTLGAAAYTALIRSELDRWREVIRAGNIRAD